MNHVNYFKDLFETIPDSRKVVLWKFLIKNDVDLLNECGFLKDDIRRLCVEYENILKEQNEEKLDCIKKS